MNEATEPRPVGRPAFQPTPEIAEQVERYAAAGMKALDIARTLRITTPTLRKYFAENLANGAARKYAAIIDQMFEAAKAGNASIMKRLEEIIRTEIGAQAIGASDHGEQKPRKLGKKEEAAIEAETAGVGTDWGDDLRTLMQ